MLTDDVHKLKDAVSCMDRNGHVEFARQPRCLAELFERAHLYACRTEQSLGTPVELAIDRGDEIDRLLEDLHSVFLVPDADELAALAAHPASDVVAGAEISAQSEDRERIRHRPLHVGARAELDECRHAVAQQFHDRVLRPDLHDVAGGFVGAHVAGIAVHDRALPRRCELEERLAEVVDTPDIADQAEWGEVAAMNMSVDEAGGHKLAAGIDRLVDIAFKLRPDVNDLVVFEYDDAVLEQNVGGVLITDNPTTLDKSTH